MFYRQLKRSSLQYLAPEIDENGRTIDIRLENLHALKEQYSRGKRDDLLGNGCHATVCIIPRREQPLLSSMKLPESRELRHHAPLSAYKARLSYYAPSPRWGGA